MWKVVLTVSGTAVNIWTELSTIFAERNERYKTLFESATGIFRILGSFDTKCKKYSKKDIFVGIFGMFLYHNTNENNNVNGSICFADLTDFQLKHQTFWSLEDLKKLADVMNVSFVDTSETSLLPPHVVRSWSERKAPGRTSQEGLGEDVPTPQPHNPLPIRWQHR